MQTDWLKFKFTQILPDTIFVYVKLASPDGYIFMHSQTREYWTQKVHLIFPLPHKRAFQFILLLFKTKIKIKTKRKTLCFIHELKVFANSSIYECTIQQLKEQNTSILIAFGVRSVCVILLKHTSDSHQQILNTLVSSVAFLVSSLFAKKIIK